MRRRRLRGLVLGGVAVVFAIAAVLGYVSRGEAAGTNICPGSTCLSAVVSPHVASAVPDSGFSAFASGRLNNNATSTATHLNLAFSFKDTTNPNAITDATVRIDTSQIVMLVDGSSITVNCSTTPGGSGTINVTSVSCSFPNLAGGHWAKVQIPFTPVSPTAVGSHIQAFLQASYGEGNGGSNDTQTASDTLTIADPLLAAGKCTKLSSQISQVGDSTTTVGVTNYPAVTGLPCTPVSTGVDQTQVTIGGVKGEQIFLELPQVSPFATLQHDLTPIPGGKNLNNLVIWEAVAFEFNQKVPACDASGLPPNPGSPGFSTDTCIFDKSPLPKGGGRYIMHALGNLVDPRYTP
jgi:hypothetical protein